MNNLSKSLLIFSLFVLVLPITSHAACNDQIKRTLSKGMKGEDVKILQRFLNDNPVTAIAKTGINSKGKESGIFDNATLVAVKNFQKSNSNLILKPAGLTVPNGVIGTNARNLLNSALCPTTSDKEITQNDVDAEMIKFEKKMNDAKSTLSDMDKKIAAKVSESTSKTTSILNSLNALKNKMDLISKGKISTDDFAKDVSSGMNSSSSNSSSVKIESIMPFVPKVGDKMYLFGDNFAKENIVYIGDKSFNANKASTTDRFVYVNIPINFTLGNYDVYISNVNGKSEKVKVQITTNSTQSATAPKIISVSPKIGNIGTEITLSGTGFTKDNTVHTTTKSFTNIVSTDGKTIKIKIDADKGLTGNNGKLITQLPFSIFVRNENGDSNVVDFKLE